MRQYNPGYVQVPVGLTPSEKEAIEKIANKTSRSRQDIIRRAVSEYLQRSSSLLKCEA